MSKLKKFKVSLFVFICVLTVGLFLEAGTVSANDGSPAEIQKSDAKRAVNQFLTDHVSDPSGHYVFDRYDDLNISVGKITEISTNGDAGLEKELSRITEQERGDGQVFTRTEIFSVDGEDITMLDPSLLARGAEDLEDAGQLFAAQVKYKAQEADPEKVAHIKRSRAMIAQYADVEKYKEEYTPLPYCADPYTDEQKQELKEAAATATAGCQTDYDKIYAVYRYVASNIYYYDDHEGNEGKFPRDAYGTWKEKTTVCDGYGDLCECLLRYSGIACFEICSAGDNPEDAPHAYNVAYDSQDKRWIYFDATWGSWNSYYASEHIWKASGKASEKYSGSSWKPGNCNDTYFDMTEEFAASIDYHLDEYNICYLTDQNSDVYYEMQNRYFYRYDISSSGAWMHLEVYEYKNNVAKPVIGKELGGTPVDGISVNAFKGCTNLEELDIPNTIKELYSLDLQGCVNLKKLTIPDSVKKIWGRIIPPDTNSVDIYFYCDPESFYSRKNALRDCNSNNARLYVSCMNEKWTEDVINKFSTEAEWIYTHQKGNVISTKEPTCGEEGYTDYECVLCGKTVRESIPKLTEHTWDRGKRDPVDPSAILYTCKVCGETNEVEVEVCDNPAKISKKTRTVRYSKLKKKARTVAPIIVKNAKSKVIYEQVSGNAKSRKALKLNYKTGKIKVRKGTKKGVYKLVVRVTASDLIVRKPKEKIIEEKEKVMEVKVIVK